MFILEKTGVASVPDEACRRLGNLMLQMICRTGELERADVPIPTCSSNKILVKNIASLISIGTDGPLGTFCRHSL